MKNKQITFSGLPKGNILGGGIEIGPVKKLMSVFIFVLAKEALRRSKRSTLQHRAFGILEAYILTVAALEAFINEFCIEKIEQRKEAKKSTSHLKKAIYPDEHGHFMDIKQKYECVPRVLWSKSFDKGGKLWNDFVALIRLRNDIMHYTPEWESPGYVPDYLSSIYRRIVPRQAKSFNDEKTLIDILNTNKSFIDRICIPEMGMWALDTGVNMVQQFLLFCSLRDSLRDDYIMMFERARIRLPSISWGS